MPPSGTATGARATHRGVGTSRAAPSSSCVTGYTSGCRSPPAEAAAAAPPPSPACAASTLAQSSRQLMDWGAGGEPRTSVGVRFAGPKALGMGARPWRPTVAQATFPMQGEAGCAHESGGVRERSATAPLPSPLHLPAVDLPERVLALHRQRVAQQHAQLAHRAKRQLVRRGWGGGVEAGGVTGGWRVGVGAREGAGRSG